MPEPSGPDPGKDITSIRGDYADRAPVGGERASWIGHSPPGAPDELTSVLSDLLERIDDDTHLSEAERSLATAKVEAIMLALRHVDDQPRRLYPAILDANVFLTARVAWAWEALRSALQHDRVQGVMSRLSTGTSDREAIDDLLRA